MAVTASWLRRATLTVDNTKVSGSGDHTDMETLVAGGNFPADVYTNADAAGDDLRFTTDAAGANEVPFEIVFWTPGSSLSEVWLKVPTIDFNDDTVFYVFYDNVAAAAYARGATFGSDNVWTKREGVWHFQGNSNDSTANQNDGTDVGSPSFTAAQIGNGIELDGSTQYSDVANDASLNITGDLFMEAWINPDTIGPGQQDIIGRSGGEIEFALRTSKIGHLTGNDVWIETAASTITTAMTHIATNYDSGATTVTFYKNGASVTALTEDDPPTAANAWQLGANGGAGGKYDGHIDELRIGTTLFSADYIATQYNNTNSPSTFITGSDAGLRPVVAGRSFGLVLD